MSDAEIVWPKRVWTPKVVKRNKRLMLTELESGKVLYSPPDFVKIISRQELEELGSRMQEAENPIDAIVDYESKAKRWKF